MTLVAAPTRHVSLTRWQAPGGFEEGTHQGTEAVDGGLRLAAPAGTLVYADPFAGEAADGVTYEWGAWVSPAVETAFGATEVVPSWNASTPEDSWLELEARAAIDGPGGREWTPWMVLARWADSDRQIHPTSVPGQGSPTVSVRTDVLGARDEVRFAAHQLRVTLLRPVGSTASPSVRLVTSMASRVPATAPEEVSAGGAAWGLELRVPPYSQQLHRGQYVHWDRGGPSWCSPTSTSMLLAYHGRLPAPEDYAWVEGHFPNRFVVQAARHVFDYAYGGAGNWAFNTAYAGRPGVQAFVTRLRSLAEAETFVAAGLPLAATVSFTEQMLTGAGYATEGHLLTIVGFTAEGDVICNDPASHTLASNDEVRVVFDRAELERVWLDASGGVVYVVHPDDVPLPAPADPAEPSW